MIEASGSEKAKIVVPLYLCNLAGIDRLYTVIKKYLHCVIWKVNNRIFWKNLEPLFVIINYNSFIEFN